MLAHTDRIGLVCGTLGEADDGGWHLRHLRRVAVELRLDRFERSDPSNAQMDSP